MIYSAASGTAKIMSDLLCLHLFCFLAGVFSCAYESMRRVRLVLIWLYMIALYLCQLAIYHFSFFVCNAVVIIPLPSGGRRGVRFWVVNSCYIPEDG